MLSHKYLCYCAFYPTMVLPFNSEKFAEQGALKLQNIMPGMEIS